MPIVGIGAGPRGDLILVASELRVAEAYHRLCGLAFTSQHPKSPQVCDRWEHGDRMPLYQPGGIAVVGHIVALHLRHSNRWLVRHQQVKRQRSERAGRHYEESGLVLDQRLDRPEQRKVKLVCGSEIE